MNEDQHMVVNDLFYSVSDIERVGDHVENIVELMDVKEDGEPITFFPKKADVIWQRSWIWLKNLLYFPYRPEKRSAWMMQIKF